MNVKPSIGDIALVRRSTWESRDRVASEINGLRNEWVLGDGEILQPEGSADTPILRIAQGHPFISAGKKAHLTNPWLGDIDLTPLSKPNPLREYRGRYRQVLFLLDYSIVTGKLQPSARHIAMLLDEGISADERKKLRAELDWVTNLPFHWSRILFFEPVFEQPQFATTYRGAEGLYTFHKKENIKATAARWMAHAFLSPDAYNALGWARNIRPREPALPQYTRFLNELKRHHAEFPHETSYFIIYRLMGGRNLKGTGASKRDPAGKRLALKLAQFGEAGIDTSEVDEILGEHGMNFAKAQALYEELLESTRRGTPAWDIIRRAENEGLFTDLLTGPISRKSLRIAFTFWCISIRDMTSQFAENDIAYLHELMTAWRDMAAEERPSLMDHLKAEFNTHGSHALKAVRNLLFKPEARNERGREILTIAQTGGITSSFPLPKSLAHRIRKYYEQTPSRELIADPQRIWQAIREPSHRDGDDLYTDMMWDAFRRTIHTMRYLNITLGLHPLQSHTISTCPTWKQMSKNGLLRRHIIRGVPAQQAIAWFDAIAETEESALLKIKHAIFNTLAAQYWTARRGVRREKHPAVFLVHVARNNGIQAADVEEWFEKGYELFGKAILHRHMNVDSPPVDLVELKDKGAPALTGIAATFANLHQIIFEHAGLLSDGIEETVSKLAWQTAGRGLRTVSVVRLEERLVEELKSLKPHQLEESGKALLAKHAVEDEPNEDQDQEKSAPSDDGGDEESKETNADPSGPEQYLVF